MVVDGHSLDLDVGHTHAAQVLARSLETDANGLATFAHAQKNRKVIQITLRFRMPQLNKELLTVAIGLSLPQRKRQEPAGWSKHYAVAINQGR